MKTRPCPICKYEKSKVIYRQKFTNHFYHKIAYCNSCGFVYVNNTPGQKYYNEYYKTMSKYEHERDRHLHNKYVKIISRYVNKKLKILDIGCSTGHLISLLKNHGFKNVSGIDPSPICRKIALRDYDLKIKTSDLDNYQSKTKYDLIILAAILEHIDKLTESIEKITNLLSDEGYVFISVPDATNFYKKFDEPFGEFSTEHINFFSEQSLFQLMKNYRCQYIKSDNKVIYSIWQKGSHLKKTVSLYINLSEQKMKKVTGLIDGLPKKILVWGAGSLTQRLLKSTNLSKRVLKFIDINTNLSEKKLAEKAIIQPKDIYSYSQPIFISTYRFKSEILNFIKSKKIKNKIITLD